MAWVLPDIVTRDTGLTAHQLRGMCRRGKLAHGYHWKVVDRKTFYHFGRVQEWLDSEVSDRCMEAYRSDTKSGGSNTANGYPKPPRSKPYRMQLDSDAA